MEVFPTKLNSVLLIKPPTIFEDFRGHYVETYNKSIYYFVGHPDRVHPGRYLRSYRNVLRGIHGDNKTWKLISASMELLLRRREQRSGLAEYRQWQSFTISDVNRLQVLVPPKFGNGHLVMSEQVVFHYKQTTEYDRSTVHPSLE